MKLIQIVDDLGADRGIIVTTSYFTPEAIKTAKGHNVELWNREQILKFLGEIQLIAVEKGLPTEVGLKERVAHPTLTIQDAERTENSILEQRAKGGFLGKGKIVEKLDSTILQYFPYYEAEIQATISEIEKTGWRSTRSVQKLVTVRVSFDALNGDIVIVDEKGVYPPYTFLKFLNEDEIKVFKAMKEKVWCTVQNIVGLGFSEGKSKKILSGLVTKNVLETSSGQRGTTIYRPKTLFPNDPRLLRSISDALKIEEISKANANFVPLKIEASDIMKRIESYWNARVNSIAILYYPYYLCNLITQDGSKRMDTIDAISGRLREY